MHIWKRLQKVANGPKIKVTNYYVKDYLVLRSKWKILIE